jgi:hypothetical protein
MAVIAVLGSLMLGAVAKTTSQGRRIACVSNERQIALQTQLWVIDHGFRFPERSMISHWRSTMGFSREKQDRYLFCPEELRRIHPSTKESEAPDPWATSYIMNGFADYHLESSPAGDPRFGVMPSSTPEAAILEPSRTILFGERASDTQRLYVDILPITATYLAHIEEGRHGSGESHTPKGRANYVLADASVHPIAFGKSTCPVNQWAVTERWRRDAALCIPRF